MFGSWLKYLRPAAIATALSRFSCCCVEPDACAEDVIDEILDQRPVLLDQLLAHRQHAADVVAPFVARHPQRPCIAGALRRRAERLAGAIGVDRVGVQRRRHVGRRHLDDLDVLRRHALLREHLAQEQEVDRETAGNRDALAGQLA